MQAKAVVFTAPNTVEVKDISCPDPTPDDVVVRVTHSWISNGTEGSYLRGERSDGDRAWVEGDPLPFPVVAGYQKIGVVEWIGEQITDLEIGETVFCTIGRVEGMHHWYAGQVSPSVCKRHDVWKLPKGMNPLAFAGMVLAQVGYNGGIRPSVALGDTAVVLGDGMVGHWTAQTLAWRGAEVLMLGRHDDRLTKFVPSGEVHPYRHIVNTHQESWQDAVPRIFPDGVQIAVDTVGSMDFMNHIQPFMKRFGYLVSAGFYGVGDAFPLQPPRYKELTLHLVSGWVASRMDETLRLIANGTLETLPLITHHFPVAQAADAWKLIESKQEPVMGVILDW
jgi:2-desacetyl-2-hydroxyethyl bacteriochlorophyllide A dehydrogenase